MILAEFISWNLKQNCDDNSNFSSGHSYKSFVWALEIDDSRIISGDSDASLVVHDFWDYSDSPTCHEPKKIKYSSDSPICHETK